MFFDFVQQIFGYPVPTETWQSMLIWISVLMVGFMFINALLRMIDLVGDLIRVFTD